MALGGWKRGRGGHGAILKNIYKLIPKDLARVASPKMMSDRHMLHMNVCDAGRHAGTQRHEKGSTFVRVRARLERDRATRTRQTVCDPDRQRGRQGHEKEMTFIKEEDR